MITAMIMIFLSLTLSAIVLTFSFSLIGIIIILMPLLILGAYLCGHLEVNGKNIKPFYIK
jgi:hypothetical protein